MWHNSPRTHVSCRYLKIAKLFAFSDVEGKVPEHRVTGQYRNKSNRIWDPHPQYLIDAFGVHLHLILYQDNNFIPKNLKVICFLKKTILLTRYHPNHQSSNCSCFCCRLHTFGTMKCNAKPKTIKTMSNYVDVSTVDEFEQMIARQWLFHCVMAWWVW